MHKGAKDSTSTPWLNHVMQIFALFMLCGVFTTLLIPETKRKTLEELSGEDTDTLVNPSPAIQPEKELESQALPVANNV